jgi:hypothetical protein
MKMKSRADKPERRAMRAGFPLLFLSFALFLAAAGPLFSGYAAAAESGGGADAGEWELDTDFSITDDEPDWTWRLDFSFENYFNTRRELDFEDAWKKQELSARLDVNYGTRSRHFQAVAEGFFFPTFINGDIGDDYTYARESKIFRNLRIASESSEIRFQELYYNQLLGGHRLRIGSQVYPWGTADGINPTGYVNPMDMRELLLTDEEEFRLGVPSISGMFFLPEVTLELVFVPVQVAAAYPPTSDFWAVQEVDAQYPVYFDEPEPMDAESENFGFAGRASGTYRGVDLSVSAYHGPDSSMLLLPVETVLEPNRRIGVRIQPRSFLVDYMGADLSFGFGDFVFNAEAAYSPNRPGIIEQDTDRPQTLSFPYETEESGYISYAAGFNYFIPMTRLLPGHAGDSLFTMEWYQARYFDGGLQEPQITDLLSLQYQDSFFDKRVEVWLTGIFETRRGGLIFWPRLGYDFKNGFTAEVGWVGINGRGSGDYDTDSLFYYYRENDLVTFRLTYAFQ